MSDQHKAIKVTLTDQQAAKAEEIAKDRSAVATERATRESDGTYYGLTRARWDELDPNARWKEMQPRIKEIAKEIDRETFVSWFEYGSIMDPYNTGYEGEDNSGRVWWVRNRDGDGPPVTAWDFIEAHPEMDLNAMWDEIYGREEQWSRDTDPFHGIFR